MLFRGDTLVTKLLHRWSKIGRIMVAEIKIVHVPTETIDNLGEHNSVLRSFGAIILELAASVSHLKLSSPHFKKTFYISTVSNYRESLCYVPKAM